MNRIYYFSLKKFSVYSMIFYHVLKPITLYQLRVQALKTITSFKWISLPGSYVWQAKQSFKADGQNSLITSNDT